MLSINSEDIVMKKTNCTVAVLCVNALFTSIWAGYVFADVTGDAVGQQVAADLTIRYNDTRIYFSRNSIPGFTVNGAILRATTPSAAYKFWDPSPNTKASGGWSYSYLRRDAKFKRLVRHENNGNFVYPPLLTPPDKKPVQVLCAFPEDGVSDRRTAQGCGVNTLATSDSRVCYEQGIINADQWVTKHLKDGHANVNQCAFNVRDEANEKGTQSFQAFIEVLSKDTTLFDQQNEMRLATWDSTQPKTLPIQALFYLAGGLPDARFDQKDFLGAAGICLPIIQLSLPQTQAQDARFVYLPADQQCSPTPSAQYIQSAVWVQRPDPGSRNRIEWSLSVTPTQYGRDAQADRTEAVYAELEKKFGNDPQWKNNDNGSMRRQLVCHYRIARGKTPWNLEPRRKDTTEQVAEDNGCNSSY